MSLERQTISVFSPLQCKKKTKCVPRYQLRLDGKVLTLRALKIRNIIFVVAPKEVWATLV